MRPTELSEETARELIITVMGALDALCYSTNLVKNCSDQTEFDDYRRKIANVISEISDFALEPVFAIHPHLRKVAGVV